MTEIPELPQIARYAVYALKHHWTFDQIFGTQLGYEPAEWLEVLDIAEYERETKSRVTQNDIQAKMEENKQRILAEQNWPAQVPDFLMVEEEYKSEED